MLYLGGDNDLFQFGEDLLKEAQRVGSSSRVAVFAEHDPVQPSLPTRRGQIFPGRWDSHEIGITDGDAQTIIEFIEDAKLKFPAARRMLILWDHGNGWQNAQVFGTVADATTQLRLLDVRRIVAEQQDIEILCFDSCLMSMIEIAYELREKVKYIIASENVVPADSGWPYEAILRGLTAEPQRDAEDIISAIVHGFSGSYNGSNEPITLSALKVDQTKWAVEKIDELACALIDGCSDGSRQKVLFARRYCQSFGNPDYIDLVSFCTELEKLFPGTHDITKKAVDVREAVGKMVVTSTCGVTPSIRGAHGLSIYYPDRPMSPLYHKLAFAKTSTCRWAAFLHMVTPEVDGPRPMESPNELRPHLEVAEVVRKVVTKPAADTADDDVGSIHTPIPGSSNGDGQGHGHDNQ